MAEAAPEVPAERGRDESERARPSQMRAISRNTRAALTRGEDASRRPSS